MMRLILFLPLILPLRSSAQSTMITWAYGPFGTPGDAAYMVEDNRIYQAEPMSDVVPA